jgi:hypothetical protein
LQLNNCSDFLNQQLFYGLRKNVLEFNNEQYNPIVCGEGKESPYRLVMVASSSCYAAYANSTGRKAANATIVEVDPEPRDDNGNWVPGEPFKKFRHWASVMQQPILALKLRRNIRAGEEILAHYEFKHWNSPTTAISDSNREEM